MRSGRYLVLLVVLVVSISVAAPPAAAATPMLAHDSPWGQGEVDTWTLKGEGNDSTGDDDRWGDPNDIADQEEVPAEGESGSAEDPEDDERPWWPGLSLRLFAFNWFFLGG